MSFEFEFEFEFVVQANIDWREPQMIVRVENNGIESVRSEMRRTRENNGRNADEE